MTISRLEIFRQPLSILAVMVTWCLLWGEFSLGNIVNGILLAIVLHLAFPMTSLRGELSFRPVSFAWLLLKFLIDMAVSTVEVTSYVLGRARPRSSIIAVQLRSKSDLFLTLTGILTSLVPGSLIVEAQRSTGTLYLHVLGLNEESDLEAGHQRVLHQEERLLRALASRRTLEEAGLR